MTQLDNTLLEDNNVIIFGASGHAKVVIDILEKQGRYEVKCLIDDNPILKGQDIYGYNIIGGKDVMESLGCNQCVVAIGDNQDQPVDAQKLTTKVAAVLRRNPDVKVMVKGDSAANYGQVVTVMALLQKAGAPSVGLITKQAEPDVVPQQ